MLKRFFQDALSLQPSTRSFLGDASANGDYENVVSKEYKKSWEDLVARYRRELGSKRAALDDMSLRWILDTSHDLLKYPDEWMYLTSYDNPIIGFIVEDKVVYPLKTQRDVADLVSRTRKRIPIIHSIMDAMTEGATNGMTLPRMVCKRVVEQLRNIIATKAYLVHIPNKLKASAYTHMAEMEYAPVLHALMCFMESFVSKCRRSVGLCYVRDGKNMYRAIVRGYTTMDTTPEQLYEMGKKGIKQLYRELHAFRHDLLKVINIEDEQVSNRVLFEKIRAKDSEYYKTSREVLNAYRRAQEDIRKTVIPMYFEQTVGRYVIRSTPTVERSNAPGAYYMPPGIMTKRPGTVYINTQHPRMSPRYLVGVLSLHEGAPGHHYQYEYMKQNHMPPYRMYAADNDAYTEGWALYCESLLESKDPMVMYGRWMYNMFRTVRLVVDTGIHYYGWSYSKALNYMKKHVLLDEREIEIELNRYICNPGQALSYKVGEEFFLRERDYYLGHGLGDIKDFHREVLSCGPMPLSVMSKKLRQRLGCSTKNEA